METYAKSPTLQGVKEKLSMRSVPFIPCCDRRKRKSVKYNLFNCESREHLTHECLKNSFKQDVVVSKD